MKFGYHIDETNVVKHRVKTPVYECKVTNCEGIIITIPKQGMCVSGKIRKPVVARLQGLTVDNLIYLNKKYDVEVVSK